MNHAAPAYGLWSLVVINVAVFATFAYSFTRPRTARDWRSFGAFTGFLVALFAEMYGFPLTIYLLSGWLGRRYPGLDLLSHDVGHLWETLLGWRGNPHLNPLHLLSNVLIAGGFILLARSWSVLTAAYVRLARSEEREMRRSLGDRYTRYAAMTPGFIPNWPRLVGRRASTAGGSHQ